MRRENRKKKRNRSCERIPVIAFVAANCDLDNYERKEAGVKEYLDKYAAAHGLEIVRYEYRHFFGQYDTNKKFNLIASRIAFGEADAVLIPNIGAISGDLADAYLKVAKVHNAGGYVISVDEGNLQLNINGMKG